MSGVALKEEISGWLSSGKLVAPKGDNIHHYKINSFSNTNDIAIVRELEYNIDEWKELGGLLWNLCLQERLLINGEFPKDE